MTKQLGISMNILVAPSNFKESISASLAASIITRVVKDFLPDALIWEVPLADGGSGTVDSLLQAIGGEKIYCQVSDPLDRKISAYYGLLVDKTTAVIEMAASSGLALLSVSERNPMFSSSYGCGELIVDAIARGAKKIILGLGDTATVDGGIGLLQALGVKLLDVKGKEVEKGARGLKQIVRLDALEAIKLLEKVELIIASDVENLLLGEKGAAKVFGPQKGATLQMVQELEEGLEHWANILMQTAEFDRNLVGAGAAGGVATGLVSLFKAKIISGSQLIFDSHNLNEKISLSQIIFTGEGSIDEQTLQGKMPSKLAKAAKIAGIPLVAFTARILMDNNNLQKQGFTLVVPIVDQVMELEKAYKLAPKLLEQAVYRTLQAMFLGSRVFLS